MINAIGIYHVLFFSLFITYKILIHTRNSIKVLLFFILTYFLPFILLFIDFDISRGYYQFDLLKYYQHTYHLLSMGTVILIFFLDKCVGENDIEIRNPNKLIYQISFILFFLLAAFGTSSGNALTEGYGNIQTSSLFGLSIGEYILLPLSVCLYTQPYQQRKISQILFFSIVSISLVKGILAGSRDILIQIFLLFLIMRPKFFKIKPGFFLIFVLVGFYLFLLFGYLRSDFFEMIKNSEFTDIIKIPFTHPTALIYAFGNQTDIIYSSVRIHGLIAEGIINLNTLIYSGISYVFSLFIPFKLLPNYANLAGFLKYQYPAGGGVFFTSLTWIYFGPLSFLLIRFIGVKISNMFNSNKWIYLYTVMLMCTYPRWWGYSPITAFKLCFYVIPLYFILSKYSDYVRYSWK